MKIQKELHPLLYGDFGKFKKTGGLCEDLQQCTANISAHRTELPAEVQMQSLPVHDTNMPLRYIKLVNELFAEFQLLLQI